jgi:hypothetical protein
LKYTTEERRTHKKMDKKLLLKGLKIGALVLFAIGFFLPFIVGKQMGVDYSHSAFNLEALNPDKSADVFIYVFYAITVGAIALMFVKPEYERIAYLAAAGIGLILLVVVYVQVFNDADLKAFIDLNIITAKIGFGIILQIIMVVAAVVLEFFGNKLFKVE